MESRLSSRMMGGHVCSSIVATVLKDLQHVLHRTVPYPTRKHLLISSVVWYPMCLMRSFVFPKLTPQISHEHG
jgi:hypothetical protein